MVEARACGPGARHAECNPLKEARGILTRGLRVDVFVGCKTEEFGHWKNDVHAQIPQYRRAFNPWLFVLVSLRSVPQNVKLALKEEGMFLVNDLGPDNVHAVKTLQDEIKRFWNTLSWRRPFSIFAAPRKVCRPIWCVEISEEFWEWISSQAHVEGVSDCSLRYVKQRLKEGWQIKPTRTTRELSTHYEKTNRGLPVPATTQTLKATSNTGFKTLFARIVERIRRFLKHLRKHIAG